MRVTDNRVNFEAEALPHLDSLKRTAHLMLDDIDRVRDVVRESFITAFLTRDTIQPMPGYRIWLFKIMAGIIVEDWSSAGTRSSGDDCDINDYINNNPVNQIPIETLRRIFFSRISAVDVKNILTNIPDHIRLVLILSLLEGFSYRDIADIAGINRETVRTRLRRGRMLMQRELFDLVACEGKYDMPIGRFGKKRTG